MDYFKLNVLELNELISEYKKNKKNYEDNIDLLCKSLSNIESAWNDFNSKKYVNKVLSDKDKIIDYLNNLDLLYNQMYYFSDCLNKITLKFDYCKNLNSITFNNVHFQECMEIFSNISSYIVESVTEIEECINNSNSKDMAVMKNIRDQLKEGVLILDTIISNFDSYVHLILQELEEKFEVVRKLNSLDLNITALEYVPKVVPVKDVGL